MIDQSFISNYSFTKNNFFLGHAEKRIQIETADGKSYNFRIASKVRLPSCLKGFFWSKVTLGDNTTLYVNKKSLAKRTDISLTYVKASLCKKRHDFDNLMRMLSKIDDIKKVLVKDDPYTTPQYSAIQIVEKIEKNKGKYIDLASTEGEYTKEWKSGRTLIVKINPETGHADFYISLCKPLGAGGFKTVYPLIDYQTAKADYALSIQKAKQKNPKDNHLTPDLKNLNMAKRGVDFLSHLEESKRVIKPLFLIEKGVTRDENGEFESATTDAIVYLVAKRYSGTFDKVALSKEIPFKEKLILFTHVLEGVVDMHKKNIVHRDLKFDNVLYKHTKNGYKIKISDFDFCCFFNNEKSLRCRYGTYSYMAPEVMSKQKIQYPEKIDSWSLGIMLYLMCEEKPQFLHGLEKLKSQPDKQVKQVLKGIEDLPFKNLSQKHPLIPIIHGLLDPEPATRSSVNQTLQQILDYLYQIALINLT